MTKSQTALEPEELEKTLLPCPICNTKDYIGLRGGIDHGHENMGTRQNFFCANCGLAVVPSSMPSMLTGFWNRLVRRITGPALVLLFALSAHAQPFNMETNTIVTPMLNL